MNHDDIVERLESLREEVSESGRETLDALAEYCRHVSERATRYESLAKLAMSAAGNRALSVHFVAYHGNMSLQICDPSGDEERTGRLVRVHIRAALEGLGIEIDDPTEDK